MSRVKLTISSLRLPAKGRCLYRHQGGAVSRMMLSCFAALVVVFASAFAWQKLTAVPTDPNSSIVLSNPQLSFSEREFFLQAQARVRLPAIVQAGLNSGVRLTFVLQFRLIDPRTGWFDKTLVNLRRHYTLTYYELTRHYRVSAVESGVSRNYRSLSSALAGLGELEPINVTLGPEIDLLTDAQNLVASVTMRLSKSALPLPLQPIVRSNWTLLSEEYRWPLT